MVVIWLSRRRWRADSGHESHADAESGFGSSDNKSRRSSDGVAEPGRDVSDEGKEVQERKRRVKCVFGERDEGGVYHQSAVLRDELDRSNEKMLQSSATQE